MATGEQLKVIVIGGTACLGKTTSADAIARQVRGDLVSTDRLARHPGRPWGEVPAHVIEHYATLRVDELVASVMAHYERQWPMLRGLINTALTSTRPTLIVEGSAALPRLLAEWSDKRIGGVWLTASSNHIAARIQRTSEYFSRSVAEQLPIKNFITRSQRFNEIVQRQAAEARLPLVTVDGLESAAALTAGVLEALLPE